MPEVNDAITPTGFVGHDGSGPGTVTPEAARTLLARGGGAVAHTRRSGGLGGVK